MAAYHDPTADDRGEDWSASAGGSSRLAQLANRLAAQGLGGRLDTTRAATGELVIRFPLSPMTPVAAAHPAEPSRIKP